MASQKFSLQESQKIIDFLSNYTPCDVSDALVKYGVKNGGYFPNLVQRSPTETNRKTVVGLAYTVLYAPLDDPRPAVKTNYIDSVSKNSIVTIALDKSLQVPTAPFTKCNNALYGGLMSTRAKYLKANGSVIFGRIRDINEHLNLNYPVFSYGLGSTAPKPVVKVVEIQKNLDILVSNYPDDTVQTINSNDIIIADQNGVVCLPANDEVLLNKVLNYIPKRVEADELVAEDIKNGVAAGVAQKARRGAIKLDDN
ncbi:bifunctional 4-hydroxy-4-methyl-2-oxoglutarate aldolase/oxaloacetate decarboxylase [Ascoidea rubescens DSM 1968]|uniref:RraA-like protein n=1 Tax=Ascoidea rubescens DSM 1968 TaxID=1344418 RepID=A0A1D2VF65_9ASCO|nr:RraA-like protein [Ascoidea rubescens DSM 1968]ODV60328.1 RraA-like protein [Ascoidea rubescens DSM 1968]